MRTCYDCETRTLDSSGNWVCGRNKFKHVSEDTRACDHFVAEESHQCWECDYYDNGYDGSLFGKKPHCELKGVRVNEYDKACSRFYG